MPDATPDIDGDADTGAKTDTGTTNDTGAINDNGTTNDTGAVAAALTRLANGTVKEKSTPESGPVVGTEGTVTKPEPPPPDSVVEEAQYALTRLSTAAAFIDDGGERRLNRAVADAQRAGDQAVAERGDALLTTLDQFREAANAGAKSTDCQPSANHFHHGHATLLTGDGVDSER